MKKLLFITLGVLIIIRFFLPDMEMALNPVITMDKELPAFKLESLKEGKFLTEKDIPQNALISVMSIRCGFCISQHDMLKSMDEKLPVPLYLIFMPHAEENSKKEVREWLANDGSKYHKSAAMVNSEFAEAFDAYYTPTTFLIKNGRITKRFNGTLNQEKILMIKEEFKNGSNTY